jgi:hypothetical protein
MWPLHQRSPARHLHTSLRVRALSGALLAAWICTPARLVSVRWWLSPAVAASLNLTDSQRQAIDGLYLAQLEARRHCIEHAIEASDRLDDLIRDGAGNDAMLEHSHAAAVAAAEERALTRTVGEQIAAVLSAHQREQLATLVSGQVVE